MRKKLCFGILTALLALQPAGAQEHKWGQLSGSLESNSIGYIKDTEIADTDNGFASNNYLKVDYMYRGLSAGVQLEGYFPGLRGYDLRMYGDGKRFIVGSKYVNWQNDMFHVRLGNIYEQFGSGMAFRTYEDRALGFNNSVEGAFGAVNFKNYFTVKGLWGRQRLYTSYADSARVGAADLSVSLSDLFGMPAVLLNVEGSYVNHHERSRNLPEYQAQPANTHLYSARANFDWNGISLRAEYVDKSKDRSQIALRKGHAWLAELGYSYGSFSALATYRELKHMETGLSRNAQGVGNTLNYLPALTRQYTYSLANLNPYQVQAEGERGGQIDLYYSLRNKSNRHQYWNFHANMSTYYSDKDVTGESRMLWRDVNGDVERQWNKQLKTTLLVSVQEWRPVARVAGRKPCGAHLRIEHLRAGCPV